MSSDSFAEKARRLGRTFLRGIRYVLFHNGWFKLLAVIISVLMWAGLISQDESLTRDKTFQNVSVNVTGTETMLRNSYIVTSNMNELLQNVSMTAAVPQNQYENAEASVYNLRCDLSRISGTGLQEVKITGTNSATYGKVVSIVPSTIQVNVEEYAVRQRIPVSLNVTGDYSNGWYKDWYMPNPTVDPALIAVSGPRLLVQSISRARVYLDPETLDWEEGTQLTTGEIRLFNRSGDEVISSLLGITTESTAIDTVTIEAYVLPAKTYRTEQLIQLSGKPAEGYQVASVRVSPETIQVAARGEVLEQLDELPMERSINLNDLTETTVFQLKVQKPSEDAVLSNETVTVTVDITSQE